MGRPIVMIRKMICQNVEKNYLIKKKEESELLLRIQEEIKLAEEMKQMAAEENRLKIEEEERRKIAEQKSIEESERKKRKQEELDMITKLEELVKIKLTSSKG